MTLRIIPNLRTREPGGGHAFYTGVLGLEQAMNLGFIVTYVSPQNPAAQLSLVSDDPSGIHPDYSVEVEDAALSHEAARLADREIVYPLTEEPWGVRRFFVRDPTGAIANVLSHVRETPR